MISFARFKRAALSVYSPTLSAGALSGWNSRIFSLCRFRTSCSHGLMGRARAHTHTHTHAQIAQTATQCKLREPGPKTASGGGSAAYSRTAQCCAARYQASRPHPSSRKASSSPILFDPRLPPSSPSPLFRKGSIPQRLSETAFPTRPCPPAASRPDPGLCAPAHRLAGAGAPFLRPLPSPPLSVLVDQVRGRVPVNSANCAMPANARGHRPPATFVLSGELEHQSACLGVYALEAGRTAHGRAV